ncbi:MAG: hypothetical protein HY927_05155 [Elusimicrobia bacterium]|nr:hypothetical protein [Elusimicrobiota bacterium]
MPRRWLAVLVACVSLLGTRGARAEGVDFDQGVDIKSVIETVKARAAEEIAAQKDRTASWTIMVYVNAKNNLEQYGLKDVNEMEAVGSTAKVKIAVELGRIGGYDSSDGDWKGQRRYIVQKDNDASKITSPVLQDIPKADMGDWKHLVDFVKWAREKAPADRYMLVVWNHGSGWDKRKRGRDIVINGISYDDETGNNITTQQLGKVFAETGRIDVYASDACLMQMAEVGYQIKDYTDYIVGSEETEPGDGYTYDTFLGPVVAKPAMTSKEVAKAAVDSYTAHYAQLRQDATQSAVQSASLARLLAMASDWTKLVMAADETAVIRSARSAAQKFDASDNKDLVHFVRLVGAGTKDAGVKSKGAELEKFLGGEVVSSNATYGAGYKNALGLAVYLPGYSYNAAYDQLAWAKDGNWAKFARWVSDIKDDGNGGDGGGGGDDGGWDDKPAGR